MKETAKARTTSKRENQKRYDALDKANVKQAAKLFDARVECEYEDLNDIIDNFYQVSEQERRRFFTWARTALDARACLGHGA